MDFVRKLFHETVQAKEPPKKEEEEEESDEISDPMEELREKCAKMKGTKDLFKLLQDCNDRVSSKSQTTETCEQELFDFVHERDHCVSKTLFSKLK